MGWCWNLAIAVDVDLLTKVKVDVHDGTGM